MTIKTPTIVKRKCKAFRDGRVCGRRVAYEHKLVTGKRLLDGVALEIRHKIELCDECSRAVDGFWRTSA